MRTFHDSNGGEWTVFEVRRAVSTKGDWSYLPNGYSDGWLCFENETTKRRLTTYPERWRDFSDPELDKLLAQAQLAPRPMIRPAEDLSGDGSTSPDIRAE